MTSIAYISDNVFFSINLDSNKAETLQYFSSYS